jgi:peptidyl-prolyl cis-trans isomerase SurA
MGTTRLLSALRITGRALATVSVLAMVTAGAAPSAWAQETPAPEAAPEAAPAALAPGVAPGPTVQPEIGESVSAVVNDDIISSYDLVQRMRLLILTSGIQPSQENLPQIQQEALRSLVEERLQIQELRRVEKENKTTVLLTDKELDEQVADIVQDQYKMTPDQFYAQLEGQGVNRQTYRDQVRAEVSWQQYMHGRFGSRLRVGADQVKAAQQRMAEAASKPQYQLSEIYIDAARAGGMQIAFQGAQQLVEQMKGGAPFPQVARQFSSAATAASGGDAGWVSPGEMPAQVDAVLDQLRPGQLSAPIQTDDGVYVIYLRDKRAGGGSTLVTLKQAAIVVPPEATADAVAAAGQTLEQLRALQPTCADLEAKAATIPGILAGDLGESEITGLAPGFAEAAASTAEGTLSAAPIRTQGGVHLVMVCGKRSSGGEQMTDKQLENRLYGQQLVLISKRILRDLRLAATIDVR